MLLPFAFFVAIGIAVGVGMAMLDLLNATSRPPQPVPLGGTIWDYRQRRKVAAFRPGI